MTAQPAKDRATVDTASKPLPPGTPAPDFTLPSGPDSQVRLSDLRGKPVILVFYPADWSPVCGDELALFNEILPEFQRHEAQLLGISVDGVWCHRAYKDNRHLNSRCSPTSSPRAPSRVRMARIASRMVSPKGRSS